MSKWKRNLGNASPSLPHTSLPPTLPKPQCIVKFIFNFKKSQFKLVPKGTLPFLFFSDWSKKCCLSVSEKQIQRQALFSFCFWINTRIMTRSKNPPVRQQAGCSALQLHPSPRSPCSSRPLEQIDNVGQNHQAYDGKEHEDENIQHGAILSKGAARVPGKRELRAWRSVSAEKWLLFPPPSCSLPHLPGTWG